MYHCKTHNATNNITKLFGSDLLVAESKIIVPQKEIYVVKANFVNQKEIIKAGGEMKDDYSASF
jgi:hypothetical protein